MKNLVMIFISLAALHSIAAKQYTLEEICNKYGNFNQCTAVPFCQEKKYDSGCYGAQGAPDYLASLCKLQTQKQFCDIMVSQGNCVWIENSGSVCHTKIQEL